MTSFDPQWETIHKERPWGKWPDNHLVRFVYRNYPVMNGVPHALDLGCGGGAQSVFLRKYGFDVTAVDASPTAVARCQADIKNHFTSSLVVGLDYQVADVTKLSFQPNSFDLVTDVCCLQHIAAPFHMATLAHVTSVLKPGGLFFSITAKWDHTPSRGDTPLRTMRRHEVDELFDKHLRRVSLDHAEFSDHNSVNLISHWIVVARKQG